MIQGPPSRPIQTCAILVLLSLSGCGGPGLPNDDPGLSEHGPAKPAGDTVTCRVSRIVDGDTLQCDPLGRVRLLGMDAPEREQLPFGTTSTRALARLAPLGTALQVEFDVETRDEYGRILGYLWRDAPRGPLLVNWALVREGFAVVLTYPPNIRYTEALVEAQEAARTERRGLWAVDGFDCPPRDYRAGRCGG